jgi:hypothetical protein
VPLALMGVRCSSPHNMIRSVNADAVRRPVEIHVYADSIVVRQDGRVVAEHPRCFGRGETICNPWHYVPVLASKPGALKNGSPSRTEFLPGVSERVRRKRAGSDDGDRQMVVILVAVLTDGFPRHRRGLRRSAR